MNLVVICGRLCADPILKEANGRKYVSVSIAVNRPKNQGGTQTADFIECVFWNGRAEAVAKYCKKGHRIGVQGTIRTSTYEKQDGTKNKKTVIYVSSIDFQESKSQTSTQTSPQNQSIDTQPTQVQATVEEDPFTDFANTVEIRDEDLPF